MVPSTVSDIEAKLTNIVAKLDKLPLDAIGDDLRKALASLDQTLKDAGKAVNRIDTDVTPGLKTTLDDLRGTIGVVDRRAQKHGRDPRRQGRSRPAGAARRPAGDHPRRAIAARLGRLSGASPRVADPGQDRGVTERRVTSVD